MTGPPAVEAVLCQCFPAYPRIDPRLPMRRRHLGTLRGDGTVTSNGGEKARVHYDLEDYQEESEASPPGSPGEAILGLREIRGVVSPVRFFGEYELLLELEDGRRLEFHYTNSRGSIAMSRWIG